MARIASLMKDRLHVAGVIQSTIVRENRSSRSKHKSHDDFHKEISFRRVAGGISREVRGGTDMLAAFPLKFKRKHEEFRDLH